jgi:acetyltransferase-like isoleucine patch superfamily enzyme
MAADPPVETPSVPRLTTGPPEVLALQEALQALHGQLRTVMRQAWNRSLPFDELLFDRWERARALGFGQGTSIYHNSYVYGNVRVGHHTWIGPFTVLDGSGGIDIGDFCSISSGVHIYSHDSVKWALSGGKVPYERKPVKIGSCCYIGSDTVIAKGVTIGSHVLVAACSFVNRDLPDFAIAAGTPCRILGRVELSEGEVRFHHAARGEQAPDAA